MDYFSLLLSKARAASQTYNMISSGDRILCAVSGGKDSIALALTLHKLSEFYPSAFTVECATVDMGFDGADFSPLTDLFASKQIPYHIIKTEIAKVTKNENPCSLCSRMRRGALCDFAVSHGFNSLALGHNEDDAAQTALMNLLFGGRFYTFEPVTYYEDKSIKLIRPLITAPEKLTVAFAEAEGLPIIKNPCPANRASARQTAREMIEQTDCVCRGAAHRIAKAALEDRN